MPFHPEIYRHEYDERNACRARISAILARRPELRQNNHEDQPLPPFEAWIAGGRQ